METKDIIKITALVFSKKKTIAQVRSTKLFMVKNFQSKVTQKHYKHNYLWEEFINGDNES